MMDFNSEEATRRLLRAVYKPVVPSPELKEQLLQRLTLEIGESALSAPRPIWGWPKLWMPIAATIVSAVIGYGVWLSLTVVPTLVP